MKEIITTQPEGSAISLAMTSTITPTLLPEPTITIISTSIPSTPVAEETSSVIEPYEFGTPVSTLVQAIVTPTITPAPTLTVDEEGALLTALMASNNDCGLPCWWGIMPGQTKTQVIRDMFASEGIDDWSVLVDGSQISIGLGYPRSDSSYYSHDVIVQLGISNDVVQYVEVEGGYRQEDLRPTFVRDWQSYSPSEMLARYGLPTYVEFAKIENSPYFRLILSYDLLGIEIVYVLSYEYLDSGEKEICFELENVDFINLILYPPGESGNVPEPIIPNRLENYISWETTTGSDIAAFQQLFENAGSPPCAQLN